MPSKKSKISPSRVSRWREEPSCSEAALEKLATDLAAELRSGDRVLLEGPMGAGKTTFARLLLSKLEVIQPPEGSPSFAIAHEYDSRRAKIVHLDFYRIRSEAEIDEAGIPEFFWDEERIVISEWLSMWPEFEKSVIARGRCWKVRLDFADQPDRRKVLVDQAA